MSESVKVKVPVQALVLFTRQLGTMLQSGMSLVPALEALTRQPDYPEFGKVVHQVVTRVSGGNRLSAVLFSFPEVFPPLYAIMIRIGEETGQLDTAIERLASWSEADAALQAKLRSALSYPLFVLGLSVVMTLGLFYGIMPSFLEILQGLNVPLPLLTRIMLGVTVAIRHPGVWLAAAAAGYALMMEVKVAWRRPDFQCWVFDLLLHIPMLGGMLESAAMARYAASLSAMLESGTSLAKAIPLAAQSSGNPLIVADVPHALDAVTHGRTLGQYMGLSPELFPQTVVGMVSSGEEASCLPSMLARVSSYYKLDLDARVDSFGAALEPLMLTAVAGVVGTVILSVFLPLYSYVGQMGH